jgi:hypothetical protein
MVRQASPHPTYFVKRADGSLNEVGPSDAGKLSPRPAIQVRSSLELKKQLDIKEQRARPPVPQSPSQPPDFPEPDSVLAAEQWPRPARSTGWVEPPATAARSEIFGIFGDSTTSDEAAGAVGGGGDGLWATQYQPIKSQLQLEISSAGILEDASALGSLDGTLGTATTEASKDDGEDQSKSLNDSRNTCLLALNTGLSLLPGSPARDDSHADAASTPTQKLVRAGAPAQGTSI